MINKNDRHLYASYINTDRNHKLALKEIDLLVSYKNFPPVKHLIILVRNNSAFI